MGSCRILQCYSNRFNFTVNICLQWSPVQTHTLAKSSWRAVIWAIRALPRWTAKLHYHYSNTNTRELIAFRRERGSHFFSAIPHGSRISNRMHLAFTIQQHCLGTHSLYIGDCSFVKFPCIELVSRCIYLASIPFMTRRTNGRDIVV